MLEDESRPYGSRVKSLLDVASDNDGYGAAVVESNPESNPREYSTCNHLLHCTKAPLSILNCGFGLTLVLSALVVDDSTTLESPPNNETQSPGTESPRPITPTTASSLSAAPSPSLASPFIQDQPTPGSHTEHVGDVVSSTGSSRNQGTPNYCAECEALFKSTDSYRRHMITSKAHLTLGYQCRCKRLFGRRSGFRDHIENPNKRCNVFVPYVCLCGYKVKNSRRGSIRLILQHIKTCRSKHR